jgi:hypothetical protein
MVKSKILLIMTISGGLLVGCAGTGPGSEEMQQQYTQALNSAQAAYDKVYAQEAAWRDSEDLIKDAKKAAEKGEMEKAIKLLNESRKQSELAFSQYQEQSNAGNVGIR